MKTNKYGSFFILVTLGIVFSCLLGACQPVPGLPQPTQTPTPKIADTFYPTSAPATPISIPVVVTQTPPMPEVVRPAGEFVSTDTFENGKLWNSAANANDNIVAGGEKITLAVKSNMGTLSEVRGEWLPDNYYLEVIAEVRLCRGNDMFGILFRAPNDQSGYRFLISCDRMIALQQVINGTPNPMVDWTLSTMLEPGLPFPVRIGILASGTTIRIYLNQVLQIEVEKDLYRAGGLGFYARAAGDTPLTVNFSDLKIYEPPIDLPDSGEAPAVEDLTPNP